MLSNLHTHTTFCDGSATAEELVKEAIEKGFVSLGFSGHAYASYGLSYCIKDEESYRREIIRLKEKYKGDIEIYLGIEEDAFEPADRTKYEYLIGENEWASGSDGLVKLHKNPYYLTNNRAAEHCICYNPYLGKYMLLNSVGGVHMFTADTPYEKFSNPVKLIDSSLVGLYGPFTCSNLFEDNGKAFYMVGSNWGIYNVYLHKIVLK